MSRARGVLLRGVSDPGHDSCRVKRACASLIEGVVDGDGWREGRPAKVQAGKVLALLKQLLRFAKARGFREGNPAFPLDPKDLGVQTNGRSRWLTTDEMVIVWRALGGDAAVRSVKRKNPARRRPKSTSSECRGSNRPLAPRFAYWA